MTKAWTAAEMTKAWEASAWKAKLDKRQLKADMTDFDRFKLMKAKQQVRHFYSRVHLSLISAALLQRNKIIRSEMKKLKKAEKAKAKPKSKK